MNATQIADLKAELAAPQYAPLLHAKRYADLAAIVNAPPRIDTPNDEPQGMVTILPNGATDLIPLLSNAEKAAATSTTWRDLAAGLYAAGDQALGEGTVGAATDTISLYLKSLGIAGAYVDDVVDALIAGNRADLVGTFLGLLHVGGILDPATVAAIQGSLAQPDPTWQPIIYGYGESIAAANHWPRVTEADIIEAVS